MSTNGLSETPEAIPVVTQLPNGGQRVDKFFSNLECACGCENLLPQARVDMGYTFIWGHKKGKASANAPSSGKALRKPIERHPVAPVKTINLAATMDLFEAELALVQQQWEESNVAKEKLLKEMNTVEERQRRLIDRRCFLSQAITALNNLAKV